MGSRAKPAGPNLLDLVPARCVDCETGEDGRVTILRPRFMTGPLARWLQPRLRKPFFRVHLDELGSAVWSLVNGARTVGEIAGEIERRFGDRAKPVRERVAEFVRELDRGRMIRFLGMSPPS